MVDCPKCHGEKTVRITTGRNEKTGKETAFIQVCDECGGTGQVKR